MTLTQAIISGIVQGITEFLPVSSSGHLVILHSIFGMREPQMLFDIFLHAGTLISIVVFFRKDIIKLFGSDARTLLLVALGSIPTFAIGFFFKDAFERLFGMPQFVGYMLIVTGILLISAQLYSKRARPERPIGPLTAAIVGVFQGVAIIPGISRSGATIAGGMLCGAGREESFRFSFLMAIPAVGGACAFKLLKIGEAVTGTGSSAFIVGGSVAAVVGLFSLRALLGIIRKGSIHLIGIYCIAIGSFAIICLK
jgi:undecaprenyl-diphosphatase